MATTTITALPNAATPLTGAERVPMDQGGITVDASTQAIADLVDADPSGTATAAVAAHVAASDPHPQYLTEAEAGALYEPLGGGGGGATDLSYTASTRVLASSTGTDVTLPLADGTNPGLMAATDFTKLAGVAAGAEVNVQSDWDAVSGDAQILNKPTLGTAAAAATGDFATAAQGGLADTAVQPGALSTVATTGAYGDLSGTPTLGTAAAAATGDFATAAQGGLADTAVQPAAAMIVVAHGADNTVARPAVAGAVYWLGTVEPLNAIDGDLYSGTV